MSSIRVYRIIGMTGNRRCHRGTLTDAHAAAKAHAKIHPEDVPEMRLEQVQVCTDADAVLRMLNGDGDYISGSPRRTWGLTERGALREVPNGE